MARPWGLALALALAWAATEGRAADPPFKPGDHVSLRVQGMGSVSVRFV